jgi:hypothetical protein
MAQTKMSRRNAGFPQGKRHEGTGIHFSPKVIEAIVNGKTVIEHPSNSDISGGMANT